MGKIVCKKCGHLNDETQIFCANCEEVLSDSIHGKNTLISRKKNKNRNAQEVRCCV